MVYNIYVVCFLFVCLFCERFFFYCVRFFLFFVVLRGVIFCSFFWLVTFLYCLMFPGGSARKGGEREVFDDGRGGIEKEEEEGGGGGNGVIQIVHPDPAVLSCCASAVVCEYTRQIATEVWHRM